MQLKEDLVSGESSPIPNMVSINFERTQSSPMQIMHKRMLSKIGDEHNESELRQENQRKKSEEVMKARIV